MIKAFGKYWKNYFNFKGRTRRKDYWLAVIALAICTLILSAVATSQVNGVDQQTKLPILANWVKALYSVWGLLTFIPSFSLTVRRLHDTNKRGWFLLWGLVPVIGEIIVFIREIMPGTTGANRFGVDPKMDAIED